MTGTVQDRTLPGLMTMLLFGAASGREVPPPRHLKDGRTLYLELGTGPEGAHRVRLEEPDGRVSWPGSAFPPLPRRPAGYPDDLPFVAGRPVIVAAGPVQRLVTWPLADDVPALVDELARESAADGWVVGESGWLLFGATLSLRRAGATRLIMTMIIPPMVMLSEPEEAGD